MFKNLTIRQISFFLTISIWLLHISILLTFYFLGNIHISAVVLIIYALVSLVVGYLVIRGLLEHYIFRKIKLVYKVISDSKDSLKHAKESTAINTTLEEVNEKVIEWAFQTEQEIAALKTLENYRKKFFGDISHELKTPIFSIQGYLHTLLDGGVYDDKINIRYLQRAASNVSRLQTIVDDLEMIYKLESEAAPLEMSVFSIKELFSEVMADMELQAKEKNIEIDFKSGADQDFNVYADRNSIEQVIINLISNSVKYGIDGGLTKVSFYNMDSLILVEISDNGIGISEEDLKHIFDRFYRADKSRSRVVGGSGLGLSIVKHIMEAHKQKLTVRSTLDKGSTFGFTLQQA